MRVNKTAPLGAFANNVSDKAPKKYRTGFVPTPKNPNVVQAPSMSLWKQPVYTPDSHQSVRRGADDHQRIKSRGL